MSLRRKLASQSALIFGMRIFGAGLGFLGQALMARVFGSAVLGEYLLFAASLNVLAMIMPLGFQTVGTYFAADYLARSQGGHLRRFALRSYLHIGLSALVLFGLGSLIIGGLGAPGAVLGRHWLPAAAIGVSTALVFFNGALLVGLKRPIAGFFADALLRPMLVFLASIVVIALGMNSAPLEPLLRALALGLSMVAAIHTGFTLNVMGKISSSGDAGTSAAGETRRWWRFAVPWVITGLAVDFFFDLDLLALSGLLDHSELAIFGISARIFSLAAFGVAAIYAVVLPHMFEDAANSDTSALAAKMGDANMTAAGLSALFFIAVGLGGPFALLLFGPTFLVGSGPLAVLALGLVVRAIFGPGALILSMQNRPYASLPGVAAGVLTLFAANLVLVPLFGLMGASVAALLATFVWSALLWWLVKRETGIDISVYPRLERARKARFSTTS